MDGLAYFGSKFRGIRLAVHGNGMLYRCVDQFVFPIS